MIFKKYLISCLSPGISSFIALLIIFLSSCSKGPQETVEVYNNDFEGNDLSGIQNAVTTPYNNSTVLGKYNSSGFDLQLENLPDHDLVQISFDLYIHDSWDGNLNGDNVSGPDIWQMKADNNLLIYTTFSNKTCPLRECSPQSYPSDFPNYERSPKTGAFRSDLPGACLLSNLTSQYKILKTIKHTDHSLVLQCLDKLKQINVTDPLCDESWSVDNIVIKAVKLD